MPTGQTTPNTVSLSSKESYVPHEYQKQAIKLMLSQACLGLLLPPGLGKTSIVLSMAYILLKKKMTKGILVIAPLRPATLTWPAEVDKWEQFKDIDLVVLHGKDKDKLLAEQHDVYVINPEGLGWLFEPTVVGKKVSVKASRIRMLMQKFDILVVDESTKFKSYSSLRFRILRAVLNFWRRRYILTGTPAPNGLKDLWAQIYILDQGSALEPYITHFRNKYFYSPPWNKFELTPYAWAAEAISLKIAPLTLQMRAEDYLELPELVYNRLPVVLPPEARKKYNAMEDEFILRLKEGDIVAGTAAVASGKLRQIANGAAYVEGGYAIIHEEKVDALMDLIEQLQETPLFVAVEYHFEKDMIRKARPNTPMLGEGKDDAELIRLFNLGMIPVLLGNPASVGHGLNLQKSCNNVAFFSLTWNLENFDQFIRRVLRQGNTSEHVICHLIMAEGTIDEAVWQTLMSKDKVQEDILLRLKHLHQLRNLGTMVSSGNGAATTPL